MQYIRTDMNQKMATGHMMRCLAIADAARGMGEDTTFILADAQAADILEHKNYRHIVLGTRWDHMEEELPILKKIIEEEQVRVLLVDSYQVTYHYLACLKEQVKTVYIDDLNRFVYPVTALICYAAYWEEFSYEKNYSQDGLFLGMGYAPLRKEFSRCRKKQISSEANRLLLLSGGTDPYDTLDQLTEEIMEMGNFQIQVICGRYYPKLDYLIRKYQFYSQVNIHGCVDEIKVYMEQADIVITAGGTTLYELCAVGTPTISYSIADNQLENVRKFHADGLIDYAGDVRHDPVVGNIKKYLKEYMREPEKLSLRSERMQNLVDGKGAGRIAEAILRLAAEPEIGNQAVEETGYGVRRNNIELRKGPAEGSDRKEGFL